MSMTKEIAPDLSPSTEPAGSTESLGAWLARTRAGYGAEPRDMARHLGLNPIIILALEADDFARLGPPVFVRGYLSRYARLLDLPESAVLERYRQQSGASQEPPPLKVVHSRQQQTRVRDLRGLVYLLVVIGIGWTAVQHLETLDPGRLLAWWPRSDQASAPPPANKPMAATTQTQYPFQSAPAEAARESSPPHPRPRPRPRPCLRPASRPPCPAPNRLQRRRWRSRRPPRPPLPPNPLQRLWRPMWPASPPPRLQPPWSKATTVRLQTSPPAPG